MNKVEHKVRRSAATGRLVETTSVVGITSDGVRILKSPGKATHFTDRELAEAVGAVRTGHSIGSAGDRIAKKG